MSPAATITGSEGGGGGASSLRIVATPTAREMLAPEAFDSCTENCSLGSLTVSPTTETLTVALRWRLDRVSVPLALA